MADEVIARSYVELLPRFTNFSKQVAAGVKQQIGLAAKEVDRSVGKVKQSVDQTSRSIARSTSGMTRSVTTEAAKANRAAGDEIRKNNKTVERETTRATGRISKSFHGVSASVGQSFRGLGPVVAGAFAGTAVVGFLKQSVDAASNLNETASKTSVIFGKQALPALQQFAKDAVTGLGQSQQSALDAAATFGIFGKSAGLSGGELVKFSTGLTTLSSDMASFSNTSPEEAIQAIGAALRGENEPIRRYGVLIDDASTRQEALRLGIVKTTKEALTPQQRVLAVQSLIFKQTKDAQGDFARTSSGLANQQRILSAQISDVKVKLGTLLLPTVLKVVTAFNQLLTGARENTGAGGKLVQVAKDIGEAFSTSVRFIRENWDWLKILGGAVLGVAVAYKTLTIAVATFHAVQRALEWAKWITFLIQYHTQVTLVQKATKVWTAVQWLLNAAMAANPIGIVIVAVAALAVAFVVLWKRSETFRKIVTGAFDAVVGAARTAFEWIRDHWKLLVSIIGGPVVAAVILVVSNWEKIKAAFAAATAAVIGALRTAGKAIVDAVEGPLKTIFNFIKAVWIRIYPILVLPFYIALRLIETAIGLIRAVFTGIWNWVSRVFARGWAKVSDWLAGPIAAARKTIGDILVGIRLALNQLLTWARSAWRTSWAFIRKWIVDPVQSALRAVQTALVAVRNSLQAAYVWVRDKFRVAWGFIRKWILDPIQSAVTAVRNALGWAGNGLLTIFSKTVTAVGNIWAQLQEKAKKPIRFVIKTVLNDGLIAGFNWIAGKFQAPKIDPIPVPFAHGGRVFGAGTATSDSIPARLSRGEFVEPTATVRHYGAGFFEALRKRRIPRDVLPTGYAGGGLIDRLKDGASKALGTVGNVAGGVKDFLSGPADWFRRRFAGPLGRLKEIGDSAIVRVVKKVPQKAASMIIDKAKSILSDLGGIFSGGPSEGPGAVQLFRGKRLNARTVHMLMNAERAIGGLFHITQGSYSTSVAASGSTHAGGGAMDTDDAGQGWTRAQNALRAAGFAAWHRTPSQGPWGHHIHSIAIGDPTASASAKRQVQDYLRGGNGLGGYAGGAWKVLQNHLAMVHSGEMVAPEPVADQIRALTATRATASRGGGDTYHLYFPHYVGDKDDLVKAWDELRRKGRIK